MENFNAYTMKLFRFKREGDLMIKLVGARIKNFGILKDFSIGQTNLYNSEEAFSDVNIFIGEAATGKKTLKNAFSKVFSFFDGIDGFMSIDSIRYSETKDPIEITTFFKDEDLLAYKIIIGEKKGYPILIEESLFNISKNQFLLMLKSTDSPGKACGFFLDDSEKQLEIEVDTKITSGLGVLLNNAMTKEISTVGDFLSSARTIRLQPDLIKAYKNITNSTFIGEEGKFLEDFLSHALKNDKKKTKGIIKKVGERFSIKLSIEKDFKYIFFSIDDEPKQHISKMSDELLSYLSYMILLNGLSSFPDKKITCLFASNPENYLSAKNIESLSFEVTNSIKKNFLNQFFAVTYSPFFLNSFTPENVWAMLREADGSVSAKRVSEYPFVKELYKSGGKLGDLWYDEYF